MEYGTWIFLYFLGEAVDVLEIASVKEVNWALEVWMCSVQERLCVGLYVMLNSAGPPSFSPQILKSCKAVRQV